MRSSLLFFSHSRADRSETRDVRRTSGKPSLATVGSWPTAGVEPQSHQQAIGRAPFGTAYGS